MLTEAESKSSFVMRPLRRRDYLGFELIKLAGKFGLDQDCDFLFKVGDDILNHHGADKHEIINYQL